MIKYSIIIPHRNSLDTLPKLLDSIPRSSEIEIIIVDNSPHPILKENIITDRNFVLLWSDPKRFAGGARNVGISAAKGKWLIFADADDYFAENAFITFDEYNETNVDVVYFCMTGIYLDTGKFSNRGDKYTNLVRDFLNNNISELDLRLNFHSPCSKMVLRSFVNEHLLTFDEVRASNDVFFSTKVGFFARKIHAVDVPVYVATVSTGSLTRSISHEVSSSRFMVTLNRNKFLRQKKLSIYQGSVMIYFYQNRRMGLKYLFKMFVELIKFRQNPFVGASKWISHFFEYKSFLRTEKQYISN